MVNFIVENALDTQQNNDGNIWHIVNGSFSIHPMDICDGSQVVYLDLENQLQSQAEISINGHKMTLTLSADSTSVSPSNFTYAGAIALVPSQYDSNVTCVGSISD